MIMTGEIGNIAFIIMGICFVDADKIEIAVQNSQTANGVFEVQLQ